MLLLSGVAVTVGIACLGCRAFLFDERMRPAPRRSGRLLADLHAHPSATFSSQRLTDVLTQPGLLGLTHISSASPHVLTYETALQLPGVREIDKGILAVIEARESVGYFARTQEIVTESFHLNAVAFEGEGYLPDTSDPREAIDAIHKRNGVVILNHPYVTPNRHPFRKYRLINRVEESMVRELCSVVDEIETFNAQCINPTFGLCVPNMKVANQAAVQLAKESGKRGIVSSDTHRRLDQAKLCGIYIDEAGLTAERLRHDIRNGRFENNYTRYVSRWSFLRGMFG